MLRRSDLTLAMTKRVLMLVCHRIEASRPTGYVGIEGVLQLFGDAMTLAKRTLPPQGFDAAKDFMILQLNHLTALCTTPVPSGVCDGESPCGFWCNIVTNVFQSLEVLLHPFSGVTSTIGPYLVASSSTG